MSILSFVCLEWVLNKYFIPIIYLIVINSNVNIFLYVLLSVIASIYNAFYAPQDCSTFLAVGVTIGCLLIIASIIFLYFRTALRFWL